MELFLPPDQVTGRKTRVGFVTAITIHSFIIVQFFVLRLQILPPQGAIFGGLFGFVVNLWISIGAYTFGKQEVSLPGDVSNCFVNGTNVTIAPPTTAAPAIISTALDDLYSISYLWYSAIGVLTTLGVGLIVTGITGEVPVLFTICPAS